MGAGIKSDVAVKMEKKTTRMRVPLTALQLPLSCMLP
jgi:hypothetical protein